MAVGAEGEEEVCEEEEWDEKNGGWRAVEYREGEGGEEKEEEEEGGEVKPVTFSNKPKL